MYASTKTQNATEFIVCQQTTTAMHQNEPGMFHINVYTVHIMRKQESNNQIIVNTYNSVKLLKSSKRFLANWYILL